MGLKSWLRNILADKRDENVEFPEDSQTPEKINVRIDYLSGAEDVDRVSKLIRSGNIMLLKVKDLQKKDLGLFQSTVQKLKRNCSQFGWDIVGIEEGYILVAPNYAKIER